jgi:hypothetical protein
MEPTIRLELAGSGIVVALVEPGMSRSEMSESLAAPDSPDRSAYETVSVCETVCECSYLPVEAIEVARPRWVFAWAVLDFLGYYMMRAPLILFLWWCLRSRHPALVDSASFCGLLFVVLAVTATSVLTGGTMGVMAVYPGADPAMQVGLQAAWEAIVAVVRQGLWQFSMVPWTVWAWVMGGMLAREERLLGRALQSIGLAAAVSAIAPLFSDAVQAGLGFVHDYQVHFYSIWMLWAGVVLLRRETVIGAE